MKLLIKFAIFDSPRVHCTLAPVACCETDFLFRDVQNFLGVNSLARDERARSNVIGSSTSSILCPVLAAAAAMLFPISFPSTKEAWPEASTIFHSNILVRFLTLSSGGGLGTKCRLLFQDLQSPGLLGSTLLGSKFLLVKVDASGVSGLEGLNGHKSPSTAEHFRFLWVLVSRISDLDILVLLPLGQLVLLWFVFTVTTSGSWGNVRLLNTEKGSDRLVALLIGIALLVKFFPGSGFLAAALSPVAGAAGFASGLASGFFAASALGVAAAVAAGLAAAVGAGLTAAGAAGLAASLAG